MLFSSVFRASVVRLPAIVVFFISVIIGVLVSLGLHDYASISDSLHYAELPHSLVYNKWLRSNGVQRLSESENASFSFAITKESDMLADRVRVLCFAVIDTKANSIYSLVGWGDSSGPWRMATAIINTWGKRCDKLVFFSNSVRRRLKGVDVILLDGVSMKSWSALRSSLKIISSRHLDSYQWFLRVELDSFVILENLRYYLSVFDSNLSHYLGCITETWFSSPYNIYEAGIALSQGALRQLHGAFTQGQCGSKDSPGDRELGSCLASLDVSSTDTRDRERRGRFLPSDPEDLLIPDNKLTSSFWSLGTKHQLVKGSHCCSDYAIIFHNVNWDWIQLLEYFVYGMKPYGKSMKRTTKNRN